MSDPIVRIGVDVGGTNTDAVIVSGKKILGWVKHVTTPDVTTGIVGAIKAVLEASKIPPSSIRYVAIGTTHFVNSLLQFQNLSRVAVLRLCGPATQAYPPGLGWPASLKSAVIGYTSFCNGGHDFDGSALVPFREEDVIEASRAVQSIGNIFAFAVTAVFANMNTGQECLARSIIVKHFPGADVTLSHEISHIGFLERENAAILNASLRPIANKIVKGVRDAIASVGLEHSSLFFTQNDGTLMSAADAQQYPIRTISSGPTNSMRGAAFLSGIANAVVIDIGGTSTDVGLLVDGMPKEAGVEQVFVAGVPTNFRMPEVFSIALGGGTLVSVSVTSDAVNDTQTFSFVIGPNSVGREVFRKGTAFGGSLLTITDMSVAAGLVDMGSPELVHSVVPQSVVQSVLHQAVRAIADTVARVRTSPAPIPVVLVGGGAALFSLDVVGKECGLRVIRPEHGQVANAIGAAIGLVSADVDMVMVGPREACMAAVVASASSKLHLAGADISTQSVLLLDDLPLTYLPTASAFRVRAKLAAEVSLCPPPASPSSPPPVPATATISHGPPLPPVTSRVKSATPLSTSSRGTINLLSRVLRPRQVWNLSHDDIDYIASGTAVLGCGGGGSPFKEKLRLHALLDSGHTFAVLAPSQLAEDDLIASVGFMGAPTVADEKLASGSEIPVALAALERHLGESVTALMAAEIGGMNGLTAIAAAALRGVPVVDCDALGRAFPMMYQDVFALKGVSAVPCAIVDDRSNVCLFSQVQDTVWLERLTRALTATMGASAAFAMSPMTGSTLKAHAIHNSITKSWGIGKAVSLALASKVDPVLAVLEVTGGRVLGAGKVVDVHRTTQQGFAVGTFVVARPVGGPEAQSERVSEGGAILVQFHNENLVAWRIASPQAVPDALAAGYSTVRATSGFGRSSGVKGEVRVVVGTEGEAKGRQPARKKSTFLDAGELYDMELELKAISGKKNKGEDAKQDGNEVPPNADPVTWHTKTAALRRRSLEGRASIGLPKSDSASSAWASEGTQTPTHEHEPGISGSNRSVNAAWSTSEAAGAAGWSRDEGEVLACVPDLIVVLESDTGRAVMTEELRFGLSVTVVVLPAHPTYRTDAALEVVGPKAFNLAGVQYTPCGDYPPVIPRTTL